MPFMVPPSENFSGDDSVGQHAYSAEDVVGGPRT